MRKKGSEDWKKEWKDMPEFIQENRESIKSITVNFESEKDMQKFSELIGYNISMKTKGIFFPVPTKKKKKVYVDEP